MLLKTATGSPTRNLDLSDTTLDDTSDRQSVSNLNTNDIPKHIAISTKTITDQTHPNTCLHTLLQI